MYNHAKICKFEAALSSPGNQCKCHKGINSKEYFFSQEIFVGIGLRKKSA